MSTSRPACWSAALPALATEGRFALGLAADARRLGIGRRDAASGLGFGVGEDGACLGFGFVHHLALELVDQGLQGFGHGAPLTDAATR